MTWGPNENLEKPSLVQLPYLFKLQLEIRHVELPVFDCLRECQKVLEC